MVSFWIIRLKKIQEKKKIIRDKKEKMLQEMKAKGFDVSDAPNLMQNDADDDILFWAFGIKSE